MEINDVNNRIIEITLQDFSNSDGNQKFYSYGKFSQLIGCSQKSVEKSQKILEEKGCFTLKKVSSSATILTSLDINKCVEIYNLTSCNISLPLANTLKLEAITSALSQIISNTNVTYDYNSFSRVESLINGESDVIVVPMSHYLLQKESGLNIELMFDFGENSFANYKAISLNNNIGSLVGIDYNNISHVDEISDVIIKNDMEVIPVRINKIKEALSNDNITASIVDVEEVYLPDFYVHDVEINKKSTIAAVVCRSEMKDLLQKYFRFEAVNGKRFKVLYLEDIPQL